jgi:cystathionine beta-lyase/cystathionine gamma-synthase
MKPSTFANHPPEIVLPDGNQPLVAPIYQSVKFDFPTVGETEASWERGLGFNYSRTSNPTVAALEATLAGLQGRQGCVAVASGMGAVSTALLAMLSAGDHVLSFAESYGPTRRMITKVLGRYGVRSTFVSIDDYAAIERVLAEEKTAMVWFESSTNPVLKIADVAKITDLAHRHGAIAVLDNTFAGLESHGDLPVDLFVHSLTKYAGGHGDVMGGAIIGDEPHIRRVQFHANTLGPTLDPHAAYLIQRGLKTYHVRRRAACETAQRVAEFLAAHPKVAKVRYPGLPTDPGHARATSQMKDYGTLLCIDLVGDAAGASRFAESLRLFSMAASLGSTESLIVPPSLQQVRDLTGDLRIACDIGQTTSRLSIGLEDPEDLISDLAQALESVNETSGA